jgi:hypothetical protein
MGTANGLYSGTFNPTTIFTANKSILLTVGTPSSQQNYFSYISDASASYSGVAVINTDTVTDWGNVTSGRTVAVGGAGAGAQIRGQVFTGSSASVRRNGAVLTAKSHSTTIANNASHRGVVNGFSSDGSTVAGAYVLDFYSAIAVPSDSISIVKRLEHSLAYSFKIACS